MSQWYEELFATCAEDYEKETYTKGTVAEVDFIEQEIGGRKSVRILDIGCGTGRHAIELARRGYAVTGIDLSGAMLERAQLNAAAAGVTVDFQRRDARDLPFNSEFDLAIMLCEGAFPLMETDEMNFAILQGAARALKAVGQFIFTTLNGLFPLFHSVRDFVNAHAVDSRSRENRFDLLTFREHSVYVSRGDGGKERHLICNERYYVPSEITWLLTSLGFRNIAILGCGTGQFSRAVSLTPDHFEMLVTAEK